MPGLDLTQMLPAKFGSIWPSCFRGEDFFNISQSEKRINLKQLGQMEPNLAESIYVRSSTKFLHFVPFHQQIWPPRAALKNNEKRAITPRRVIRFTSKVQGM
jgi:hypothetical protein